MSDPRTNSEFQDVLSSIRRLISEDKGLDPRPAGKLVLTAEHRIGAVQADLSAPDAPDAAQVTLAGWQAASGQGDVRAEVLALAVGARTVDEASATLEDTIAELEAAVARTGEDFEPDGGDEALSRRRTDPALEGAFDGGFAVDEAAADEAGLDLPVTGDAALAETDGAGGAVRTAVADESAVTDQIAAAPARGDDDAGGTMPPAQAGEPQEDTTPANRGEGAGTAGRDGGDAIADWPAAVPPGEDRAGDAQTWPAEGHGADPDHAGEPDQAVAGSTAKAPGEAPDPDPGAPGVAADPATAAAASRIRRLNLAPSGAATGPDDGPTTEPWADDASQPLLAFAHTAPAQAEAEDDEPGLFGDADETVIDMETLRELVAGIIRQELQGALGERITRNVRKLVRREINRVLDDRTAATRDEG